MIVEKLLKRGIDSSKIKEIKLPKSKSKIIGQNNEKVYAYFYKELGGLFKKDIKETNEFGRKMCEKVKEALANNGFFTSDELPNYGITKEELDKISKELSSQEKDLIVILAYDKEESKKIKYFLDKMLKNQIAKPF